MGRTKLHCLRKIKLFVKFSQLLMYLFIFAWVELDSWTQEAGHIMQCKERLLFFSTPFGQLDESLVETHHGWRTRESQAMGRRLRENMVTVLAYFLHSHSHLNAVFPLTLPVIEKVVFFFSCREVLKEDESGSLKASVEEILFQSKRKRWVCLYMERDETWFYCSTESFPLCAVESFYSVLCGSSAIQMF